MRNAVKVLVLDDDRSSGNLLAEVVKRMGFKPMLVTRSLDALNMVKLQTVHAAIVDVLLPKMSGVDIVKEFRKTKFGDAPVVLVSGVFKDKNFAQEAMEKTEAMDFLFKPFGADELMSALEKAFSGLMTSETWTVQSLLTRKLTSEREMAKAVEHMDQLEGMDFPFVLSILMDVGITGHLNIVNDVGEIFGVTLVKGTIADVDSTESQSIGVLALIQKGFLVPEDWDEYQRGRSKRSSLERLVQEGFVSPHAVSVAKHEQILNDFKSICASARMQVTFVPQEDDEEPPKHAVTFAELLGLFGTSLGEFFPHEYLLKFYEPVKEAPIRKEASSKYEAAVWEQEEFRGLKGMRKAVEEGGTLASALTAHPGHERAVLLCMQYFVMIRCIFLDDIERTKSMQVMLDRYIKLYEDLQGRSA
ncbi:MAG: response regulator, partial [Bdellovibrionales bacterium]